ncbi:hypothetical protein [Macrococcus armenti]|uniref:hypothetical protein n=1 Tax=Macrococcus armenti TaxID=2875764 RepID=UPI001CCCD5FA|nr:hypothetical protein [Macrococcus armenti]UBH15150.1 hypothetical protein LAU44_10505 [Macrococcus armenti]UBH17511.1 hypothetical protein LAU39_10535 [Macrococcus armenti]UBH19775.1 hypothetical protein LAU40_10510 [Macrococcus armenti]
MYYNAYRYSDASFTICAMAPCPYVYQQLALKIRARNDLTNNPLKPWVDFYCVNMDELIGHLDRWINTFSQTTSDDELEILRKNFVESCIHEKRFLICHIILKLGRNINENSIINRRYRSYRWRRNNS